MTAIDGIEKMGDVELANQARLRASVVLVISDWIREIEGIAESDKINRETMQEERIEIIKYF